MVAAASPRSAVARGESDASAAAGWSLGRVITWAGVLVGLILCARQLTATRRPDATTGTA